MPRADFRFSYARRVRYAEVDAQAIVFNSRYLEYLDVGVSEYWRTVGVPFAGPDAFHVQIVRSTLDYRRPLRLDELFDICVRIARIGRSSMTVDWEIHGHAGASEGADDLRVAGQTISAHVDPAAGTSARVPDLIVSLFEAYEGRPLREQITA